MKENDKLNNWVIKKMKQFERDRFHGKIILNMADGNIPCIEIHQRVNKPKNELDKKNSSLTETG
jgi:hypothetical protein